MRAWALDRGVSLGRPLPESTVDLDEIVARVRAHEPSLAGNGFGWRAATAMVLHEAADAGAEVLFIERAQRPGDRWSGQMALPGGRIHDEDEDLVDTAVREAREEVGIRLDAPVGRLDDVHGRVVTNAVSTFVFTVDERPSLTLEEREVAAAVWIPVERFFEPQAALKYRYLGMGPFPAIEHDGYVVWGLTYRILEHLAAVLGRDLPRPEGFTLG